MTDAGQASVFVGTGFNDNAGANSDPTNDSPYALGATLQGQGAGEAGWAENWQVTIAPEKTSIQNGIAFEGDGALRIDSGTNQQARTWSNRQQGTVFTSIRAYVPAQGGFTLYFQDSSGTVDGGTAAQVRAYAGANFILLDGDPGYVNEDTGIQVPVGRWFSMDFVCDTATQTWEFYVDGVRYNAPDALNFRGTGSVQAIDQIDILVESTRGAYLDIFRSASGYGGPSTVSEGGAASFEVRLDQPSLGPVSVYYQINGGSATPGSDFDGRTGLLTFAPGETVKTVTVFTRSDALAEGDETFTLDLFFPTGATIGDGRGVATIVDSDRRVSASAPGFVAPNLPFAGTLTALNGAGATDTGFLGGLHFSSTDPNAALPADTNYTGADAGCGPSTSPSARRGRRP